MTNVMQTVTDITSNPLDSMYMFKIHNKSSKNICKQSLRFQTEITIPNNTHITIKKVVAFKTLRKYSISNISRNTKYQFQNVLKLGKTSTSCNHDMMTGMKPLSDDVEENWFLENISIKNINKW